MSVVRRMSFVGPACFLVLFTVWLIPEPSIAGNWKLTDRLSTQLIFSDNIDRTADSDAGMLVNVRPTINLSGDGARVKGSMAFSPSFSQQIGGGNDSDATLFLNSNFDAEVYRDVLFVNARVSAGLSSLSGRSNVGAGDAGAAGNNDTTQTFTFSVSPEIRNQFRFGKYFDVTPRLTFDTVQNESSSASSSTSTKASIGVDSGRYFSTFPWSLTFSHEETSYEDRDDTRSIAEGQVRYRINQRWLARVNAGVESADVATSRDDTNGPFWSVGGVWTPNVRTLMDFHYGQRYYGPDWALTFEHATRRTRLTGSFEQNVTNARQAQLNDSFLPDLNDTGVPSLDLNPALPPLTSEDYLNTSVRLGIALTGLRTNTALNVGWSQREYEVSGNSEETYDVTISGNRRLGSRYDGKAVVTWQQIDSSVGNDSETYQFRVGADRTLGRYSSIGLEFSHYHQDNETTDSITENRITATFSTSFL